jgi:RNA polymerase sigma-70 factor, ECF subfamily
MLRSHMNADLKSGASPHPESPHTLGDILYGAEFQQRVPETDWIAMIRAIVAGDTSAFGNLYMMTHGVVFTLVVRITGARNIAEEVTIETFHDVWRGARDYDPASGSVVAWIMNLARTRALERQRAGEPQSAALMREAVKNLTADERQVVEATFHAGANSADVAAKQGQTTAEIEARIRAALDKLGKCLAPEGPQR